MRNSEVGVAEGGETSKMTKIQNLIGKSEAITFKALSKVSGSMNTDPCSPVSPFLSLKDEKDINLKNGRKGSYLRNKRMLQRKVSTIHESEVDLADKMTPAERNVFDQFVKKHKAEK